MQACVQKLRPFDALQSSTLMSSAHLRKKMGWKKTQVQDCVLNSFNKRKIQSQEALSMAY